MAKVINIVDQTVRKALEAQSNKVINTIQEVNVWQCPCGCVEFLLQSDQNIRCVECNAATPLSLIFNGEQEGTPEVS
jgi:hypothetical protein